MAFPPWSGDLDLSKAIIRVEIAYLSCIQFGNVAEILGFSIAAQVLNEPLHSK
jgi:hypothetical protein